MAYDLKNHNGLKNDALIIEKENVLRVGGTHETEKDSLIKKSAEYVSSLLTETNTEHTVVKNIVTHDDKQIIVSKKNTSVYPGESIQDKDVISSIEKNIDNKSAIDPNLIRSSIDSNLGLEEDTKSRSILEADDDDLQFDPYDLKFEEEEVEEVNYSQIMGSNIPVDHIQINSQDFDEKQLYKFGKTNLGYPNNSSEDVFKKEKFSTARLADVTIIKVNLKKCALPVAVDFKELLEKETSCGSSNLIIDLTQVTLLDSACLGAIFYIRKKVEKSRGSVSLVNSKQTKLPLLFIHGVEKYFKLFYNLDHAISFYSKKNIAS
ncbi:MAG: STAS domain-containing protein [Melioribacteraceae bacterium]|nr:STAS domain-containing protein [Melioribacteraceae bacterium]